MCTGILSPHGGSCRLSHDWLQGQIVSCPVLSPQTCKEGCESLRVASQSGYACSSLVKWGMVSLKLIFTSVDLFSIQDIPCIVIAFSQALHLQSISGKKANLYVVQRKLTGKVYLQVWKAVMYKGKEWARGRARGRVLCMTTPALHPIGALVRIASQ